MFTKTLAIAALSLAAASALADDVAHDFSQIPNSTLTRAEVIAEYVRAKQAGELNLTGYPTFGNQKSRSTLTRAEVQREYQRAREAGELALSETAFGMQQPRRAMQ